MTTNSKKFTLSLTAQQVHEALLSVSSKIDNSDLVQNLINASTNKVPSAKAVADSLDVISGDFSSLGELSTKDDINLNSTDTKGILPINKGGTGAGTKTAAQTALGIITEDGINQLIEQAIPELSEVDLEGEKIKNELPVEHGGTGAGSQGEARLNLGIDSSLEVNEKILESISSIGGGEFGGYFDLGFEITSYKDFGVGSDGSIWRYKGDQLPYSVDQDTDPKNNDLFEIVEYSDKIEVEKFSTKSRQALVALYKAQGYNDVFFFEDGFTYTEGNDIGIYEDGTAWTYAGAGALPVDIDAGTVPSEGVYNRVDFVDILQFANIDAVKSYPNLSKLMGKRITTGEYHAGTGYGGGTYKVVITSDVAPNDANIIQSIADPLVSIKLITGLTFKSSQFGCVGDYDESTETGTDDTARFQALCNAVGNFSTLDLDAPPFIVPSSASMLSVQGVSAYIGLIQGNKGVTVKGHFYQRHDPAINAVGLALYACDGVHMRISADGGFRYTETIPITFTQFLVHIIDCKAISGGLKVKNSSNYGFLISNQYGDEGGGYTTYSENNSVIDYLISENCLQNSTFGTGTNGLTISSVQVLNPVLAGVKLSSRVSPSADESTFSGVTINSYSVRFDSNYANPLNSAGTAPNNSLAGLDYVSSAKNIVIGSLNMDFNGCTITSIGMKYTPQVTNGSRPNGVLIISSVLIKNQDVPNSAMILMDKESSGLSIGQLIGENVSKGIDIQAVESVDPQDKESKYVDIGSFRITNHDRNAISVQGYDASYFNVGNMKSVKSTGFTQQSVRFDSACLIDDININIKCDSTVTILGDIEKTLKLSGTIDCSTQAADPLNVILNNGSSKSSFKDLQVFGDGDPVRKVQINKAGKVEFSKVDTYDIALGVQITDCTSVRFFDDSSEHTGLSVLQPWQFVTPIGGGVYGAISWAGSPNNTQVGDIGMSYRRTDTGQIYMKTSGVGDSLGWSPLT